MDKLSLAVVADMLGKSEKATQVLLRPFANSYGYSLSEWTVPEIDPIALVHRPTLSIPTHIAIKFLAFTGIKRPKLEVFMSILGEYYAGT